MIRPILAAAVLCLSLQAFAQQFGGAVLTPATPATPTGPLAFTPRKVLNPVDFGARCDGSTDDTTALVTWAAAAYTGARMVIPGACVFSSPIVFPPGVNYVNLSGGTLLYAGAATNIVAVQIGQTGQTSCQATGWSISGLRLKSSTVMSGGAGALFANTCHFTVNDVRIGDQFGDDNGNWFVGLVGVGGNAMKLSDAHFRASNTGELLYGDPTVQMTDWYQDRVFIVESGLGINIAGNVGGFVMMNGDIVGNGANVKVSQDGIAVANHQVFFGPGVAIDGTDLAAFPSATGIGLEVSDPGDPSSPGKIVASGAWFSFAEHQCVQVDATAANWNINLSGGTLITCGSGAGGLQGYGALTNLSTSASLTIALSGLMIRQNNGFDLFNASAANPISVQASTFDTVPNNISGPYSGSYVDSTGSQRVRSNGALFLQGASNVIVNAGASNAVVIGGGASADCNLWAMKNQLIPGTANAVNGGCANYSIGTSGFPFTSAWIGALNFDSGAEVASDGAGDLTASATGTMNLSSLAFAKLASSAGNVIVQSEATHFDIFGAGGGTNCGLWHGAGQAVPGLMNAVSAGCAYNIGAPAYPIAKVVTQSTLLAGAAPAPSGACAIKSQTNGSTGGLFQLSATCSSASLTLTFPFAAPTTGWTCAVNAMTAVDSIRQSGFTTTSASFTVSGSVNDWFGVSCTGV